MSDRPALARLPALDGLRGLAALTVFLANFHNAMGMRVAGQVQTPLGILDLATYAESGVGVVVFLVLSGALLSLPFWRDLANPDASLDWRGFALKRFLRIAPPYYACVLAIAVATGRWREPLDLWRHVFFVNNLSEDSFYDLSMQFWTIGVFVQLYLLLLLVFLAVRAVTRRSVVALVLVASTGVGAYLLHAFLASRSDSLVLSHSTLAHLPHALLGVVAGWMLLQYASNTRTHQAPRPVVAEAALWGLLAAVLWFSAHPSGEALGVPHGRYILPWLPVLVALAVAAAPASPYLGRVLASPPLSWLGLISYGVYIYHLAAMELVERLMAGASFADSSVKLQFGVVSLTVTLVVASASYLVLERPLMRWNSRRLREVARP